MRLQDRVAVVTGSSMGIGEAIARCFAREGARVVVNSRSLERAEAVASDLQRQGYQALPFQADVSDYAQVEAMVRRAVEAWGRLDIMVNNAGLAQVTPSAELSEEEWRRVIDVDLTGVFFGCKAAGRVMLAQRRGVIINISSILGQVGLPKRAAYCAAKFGVLGLTQVLGAEWAPYGVRVVAINPAYILTPMDEAHISTGDYSRQDICQRTPMGRYGSPEEVASTAVFLASEEAGYITGCSLLVDGGWMAFGGWQGLMASLQRSAGA